LEDIIANSMVAP